MGSPVIDFRSGLVPRQQLQHPQGFAQQQAPGVDFSVGLVPKDGGGLASPAPGGSFWDKINTPTGDLVSGAGATRDAILDIGGKLNAPGAWLARRLNPHDSSLPQEGEFGSDYVRRMAAAGPDPDHPYLRAAQVGLAGAASDTASTAASFTSPVSIGTMAAGALTKAPGALGKAVRASMPVVGGFFAGQGAKSGIEAGSNIATNGATPENVQNLLYSGATAAGGAAGAGHAAAELWNNATAKPFTRSGQQFSRGEIFQEAKRQGVPMSAAEASDSPIAHKVQSIAQNSLLGADTIDSHSAAAQQGLRDWQQRFSEKALPSQNIKGGDLGKHIQGALADGLEQERLGTARDFANVDRLTKGAMVDTQPIRDWAMNKLRNTDPVRSAAPSLDPRKATAILEDLTELGNIAKQPTMDFATAQELRSRLWKVGHVGSDIIPDQAQAWAREATGVLDDAMARSARAAGSNVEGAFRNANENWKSMVKTFNDPRSALYQAMQEPESTRVSQKFLQPGSNGGRVEALRNYQKFVGDLGPIKREFVRNLLDQKQTGESSFASMKGRLSQYSDSYLKTLFRPDELAEVKKMAEVASSVTKDVNPSGTAKQAGVMSDMAAFAAAPAHPAALAVPIGRYALAKAIVSPALAERTSGAYVPGSLSKSVRRGQFGTVAAAASMAKK